MKSRGNQLGRARISIVWPRPWTKQYVGCKQCKMPRRWERPRSKSKADAIQIQPSLICKTIKEVIISSRNNDEPCEVGALSQTEIELLLFDRCQEQKKCWSQRRQNGMDDKKTAVQNLKVNRSREQKTILCWVAFVWLRMKLYFWSCSRSHSMLLYVPCRYPARAKPRLLVISNALTSQRIRHSTERNAQFVHTASNSIR